MLVFCECTYIFDLDNYVSDAWGKSWFCCREYVAFNYIVRVLFVHVFNELNNI